MNNKKKYSMTNRVFLQEVQEIRAGTLGIPSKAFCSKFLTRLQEGVKKVEEKNEGLKIMSTINPKALGYALLGDIKIDGSKVAQEIKIFQWIEFYTAINNDDIETLESVVIELLDLERRWMNQY